MRNHVVALLVSLAWLSAPAWAAPKDELLAADKVFSALSVSEGRHAAFLATMTDDVRLFDGKHPPLIGKEDVAAHYAETEKANPNYPDERLEWTPVEAEASPDGRLGWTRGTWIFTGKKSDGTALKVTGYYVTGWRRQLDGTYKFCLDIGGTDPR